MGKNIIFSRTCIILLLVLTGFIESFGAVFTVTSVANVNTTVPASWPGTLYWAINQANTTVGGPHTINFNIAGPGPYILPCNADPLYVINNINATGLIIDGTTQPGWALGTAPCSPAPIIQVVGPGYGTGISVSGVNNVTIRGLVIRNFGTQGILITNGSAATSIKGCYIGTDLAGVATAGGNLQQAINILNISPNSVIGGTTCADRNIISATGGQEGIIIDNTSNNTQITGNYIGINAAGTALLTGTIHAQAAIRIKSGTGTIIGGAGGARNLIMSFGGAGAGAGQVIFIDGAALTSNTQIINNYIGLALNGTTLLATGSNKPTHGINVNGASTFGTITNNVIAGMGTNGIYLNQGCISFTVKGNIVGLNANGLGTTYGVGNVGIFSDNSSTRVIIGGLGAGEGNTISMSGAYNIQCQGPTTPTLTDTLFIAGNFVGTNSTGISDGINYGSGTNDGIFIKNFGKVRIVNNVVANSGRLSTTTTDNGRGIKIDQGVTGNLFIIGNYIGVDLTGNTCQPNYNNGIMLSCGSTINGFTISDNYIGCNGKMGTAAFPNVNHGIQAISGNFANGKVINNYVGLGKDGTTNLGNYNMGMGFWNTSGTTFNNNKFYYNVFGLFLDNGDNDTITNNSFVANTYKLAANTEGAGLLLQDGSSTNLITDNVAMNNLTGIWLRADNTGNNNTNILRRNTVTKNGYTAAAVVIPAGTRFPLENNGQGIVIAGSDGNKVGNSALLADKNTVYANRGYGVYLNNSDHIEVRKNSIYCNGSNQAERSTPNFALRLLSSNGGITVPGPLASSPVMTAATGIALANVPSGNITSGDVVEVYFDNSCGCQLQTYLGDATNGGTNQWSFPGGSMPGAAFCTPGSALVGGGVCPPSGLNSTTATRTTSPATTTARTSEPMSCTPTVLPVEYILFTAKKYSSSSVILSWVTGTEKNNEYFEILRSRDGKTFTSVGKVAGVGNSVVANSYSFVDEGIEGAGIYYYALMQVDFDGTQSLSPVKVVSFDLASAVEVVPNSVSQGESVKILNFTGSALQKISITDLNGKVLIEKNNVSDTETEISTSVLSSALYIIRIHTQTEIITKKLVVQ